MLIFALLIEIIGIFFTLYASINQMIEASINQLILKRVLF